MAGNNLGLTGTLALSSAVLGLTSLRTLVLAGMYPAQLLCPQVPASVTRLTHVLSDNNLDWQAVHALVPSLKYLPQAQTVDLTGACVCVCVCDPLQSAAGQRRP